jgi:hypothetical protein
MRASEERYRPRGLTVKLSVEFGLDNRPSLFGMRYDAAGTVLHARGQHSEIAGAGEQKERAIAEEAGVPALEIVTGQELTREIDEMGVGQGLSPANKDHFDNSFPCMEPARSSMQRMMR